MNSEVYFKRAISQEICLLSPDHCSSPLRWSLSRADFGCMDGSLHKAVRGCFPSRTPGWGWCSGPGGCVPAAGSGTMLTTAFCSALASRPAPVYTHAALGQENHKWKWFSSLSPHAAYKTSFALESITGLFPVFLWTETWISWAVFKNLFQIVDNFRLWRQWRDNIACITRLLWCLTMTMITVHITLLFDCNYNSMDYTWLAD